MILIPCSIPLFVGQNLVIRTKSVEYMPFYLSFSMFLMSVSFFVYGVLLHDFFIYVRFKFPIVGCSFCFEGCLTVCLLVLLILVCFSISDSKRDWNHIGCHTAVAVCLLQKRIKRGRQAAIASHTYMSMPKNKVRQTIYCYLALSSLFFWLAATSVPQLLSDTLVLISFVVVFKIKQILGEREGLGLVNGTL